MPNSLTPDSWSQVRVFAARVDEYSFERVRLALESDPTWKLTHVTGEELQRTLRRHDHQAMPAIVLTPITHLERLHPRPFPIPVIGIGPPALFDVVPDGFCDDLMGDQWNPAELRYRIRRLVHAEFVLAGHPVVCTPTRLASGDQSVGVTPLQYQIITMLLRAHGANVPREALAASISRGANGPEAGRSLDMNVSRLRHKLRMVTAGWEQQPRIVAHRGSGYSLVV